MFVLEMLADWLWYLFTDTIGANILRRMNRRSQPDSATSNQRRIAHCTFI